MLRWPLQWRVKKHFPEDTGCASYFLQWPSILWSGNRVSRVLNLSFYRCVISQLSIGPNLCFSLNNIWSHISVFAKVLVARLVVLGSLVTHLRKRSWQLGCWWKFDYYTFAFSVYSYCALFGEPVSPVCLDLHEASYMETLLKSDKNLLSLLQTGATLRRSPCFQSFCLPGDKPSYGDDKASGSWQARVLGFSYLSPIDLT